jgi:hypothetical protein
MVEITPPLMPLIPVRKELPTRAGTLDKLWVTPEGGIATRSSPPGHCPSTGLRSGHRWPPIRGIRDRRTQGGWVTVDDIVGAGP